MPITGRYFPTQRSEEKVFLLLRRHWITYGIFLLLFVLITIPLIITVVLIINSTAPLSPVIVNVLYVTIPAYLLLMAGFMLYGFVDYYLDVYIVTNERIVDISQNGFFKREISELHLHQVQDVSATESGALPTFFHYGDVLIQTAGEQKNFIFRSVPHPYTVSKKIVDLHEAQLEETQRQEEEMGSKTGDFSSEFKPEILSVARKRTKEFLMGSEPLETGIGEEELSRATAQNKSDAIISGIDNEEKAATGSGEEETKTKKDNTNAGAKTKQLEKKTDESGELHENEEIDL